MARRWPVTVERDPTRLWVPDYLRAGPCGQVWAPNEYRRVVDETSWLDYVVACSHRFRNARGAWFQAHGIDRQRPDADVPEVLTMGSAPWSFETARDRGTLSGILARRGLPADWVPTPAPKMLMDLPMYGDPSPAVAALLRGE